MRTRRSFTSAMIGKSAAMIRTNSSATRSSSTATGRCRSRSAIGTTCWLTLLRVGERLGARAHVPESNVHGEHPAVQVARLDFLALLLERAAQPVNDAQSLLVSRGRQVERAPQDRLRHDIGAFVDEAHAQRLRAAQLPIGRPQRLLQLRNRLVQEPHLLERDAQVVVRLEVALVDVLVDSLLEARQHLLEVPLFVPGRLFVGDLHARVAHGEVLLENHRAQVHDSPESTASSRTFIFASRAAVLPSVSRTFAFGLAGGSGGRVATGASIASAALARSLAGSCSATRLYTARALSGRSLRSSVSASP